MKLKGILAVLLCAVILLGSRSVAAAGSESNLFLQENPPEVPEGNRNLITTFERLDDTSNGKLGVGYNRVDNMLSNSEDLESGFVRFTGLKGLKPEDTYIYRFQLVVRSAQPNPKYNDTNSMGARVIFRGNGDLTQTNKNLQDVVTKDYITFSIFNTNLGIHCYQGNEVGDNYLYVPFRRELGRAYDVVILSGPSQVSVWVDGKLNIHYEDLPKYDPYIGVNIYRASIQMRDIGVYNIAPVDPEAAAAVSQQAKMTLTNNSLKDIPSTLPDAGSPGLIALVVGTAAGVVSLLLFVGAVLLRKRAKCKEGEHHGQ